MLKIPKSQLLTFLLSTPACMNTSPTPTLIYILISEVIFICVGTDGSVTVRVIVYRIVALYLTG